MTTTMMGRHHHHHHVNNNNNTISGISRQTPMADVLLPLSNAAVDTLQGMARLHRDSALRLSPFCHETADRRREMRGWVLDTAGDAPASALPIPYNLFHGVSIAMCETTEAEVLALMQAPADTRRRLGAAVDALMARALPAAAAAVVSPGACLLTPPPPPPPVSAAAEAEDRRATWARCRPALDGVPASLHGAVKEKDGSVAFVPEAGAIIDSEAWLPELSPDGFIGLYFRWHESRLHLYVVCQSYLPRACLEFADMVHRLEDACTCGCVSLSEEAQWLRTACARNRARLIAEVCRSMGIRVPLVEDYCAAAAAASSAAAAARKKKTKPLMALVCTETLHHDLRFIAASPSSSSSAAATSSSSSSSPSSQSKSSSNEGVVRLLNFCSETCGAFNGSVCTMAPWDSVWVFQGIGAASQAAGDAFGQPRTARQRMMLPTATPRLGGRAPTMRMAAGLNFTQADPRRCKALQVWRRLPPTAAAADAAVEGSNSSRRQERRKGAGGGLAYAFQMPQAQNAQEGGGGVRTLEEDVAYAYRKTLAVQGALAALLGTSASSTADDGLPQQEPSQQQQQQQQQQYYLAFDEAVLGRMAAQGWARDQGVAKLMPLGVALHEHWQQRQANSRII